MPAMKFTFPVERVEKYNKDTKKAEKQDGADSMTFEIPAKSFLFDDTDLRTKLKTCHLGVVRQRFSDLDHFVLGSAFMENFYVVFDGEDPKSNFIALNYQGEVPVEQKPTNNLVFLLAWIAAGFLLVLFAIIAACVCVKKRQNERLNKAKAYFNQLKTDQGDGSN